jgi:hypothetical protein
MYNEVVVGVQNVPDTTTTKARGFKEGGQIIGGLHGKYFEAGMRGQSFISSTVIAGVVIPVAAATLNSKFTLWNPVSSGMNVELISCTVGNDSATIVVNCHGLLIQRNLSNGAGIPTTVTAAANLPLGVGGTARASCYTQATLTNVAIPGVTASTAVPIAFYPMFSTGATTWTGAYDTTHNFDGRIVLPPDSLVAICTTVAASTASFVAMTWAEYPV